MRDAVLVRSGLAFVLVEVLLAIVAGVGFGEEAASEAPATQSRPSDETRPDTARRRGRMLPDLDAQSFTNPATAKKRRQRGKPRPNSQASPTDPAHLPAHSRDDTGRVAPIDLHGNSKIADADATTVTDERVVHLIGSVPSDAPVPTKPALDPPRFADPPLPDDANSPKSPGPEEEPAAAPDADLPRSRGASGPPPPPAVAERLVPVPPSRRESAQDENAAEPTTPDPPTDEPPRPGPPMGRGPLPPTVGKLRDDDQPVLDVDVLTIIRMEIKRRLPYFQGCATAAQRRGESIEVRRLQATWAIAADGSIKEMKLDGISDPQLTACILRAGSRPFSVQPGIDLVIPTPIVFVH